MKTEWRPDFQHLHRPAMRAIMGPDVGSTKLDVRKCETRLTGYQPESRAHAIDRGQATATTPPQGRNDTPRGKLERVGNGSLH